MNTIFEKSDFSVCSVPVPLGYMQSQTHASIGILNGKYILLTSPYPHPHYSIINIYIKAVIKKLTKGRVNLLERGEDYENPCVYIGSSSQKYPTTFELLNGSPLMGKPFNILGLRSYCSDPDLYIEDGKIFVLNRTSKENKDKTFETKIYLIEARINANEIEPHRIDLLFKNKDISPCITYYKDRYVYIALDTNTYNDGTPCKSIFIREGSTIRSINTKRELALIKGDYDPWHISVFQYNNHLYAIVACTKNGKKERCYQMIGVFDDNLTTLSICQIPLTDYMSYRGAAVVNEEEFILYSTTVGERFKNDKTVDGRNVIMAHKPMSDVLKLLDHERE